MNKTVTDAVLMIKSAGHKVFLLSESPYIMTAESKPNTVVLCLKDDLVISATAGDPFDLDD